MNFNLPSNSWVNLLQKSEFAAQILGFEKLGLGLDNCGRTTKNAYCPIYSLCTQPASFELGTSHNSRALLAINCFLNGCGGAATGDVATSGGRRASPCTKRMFPPDEGKTRKKRKEGLTGAGFKTCIYVRTRQPTRKKKTRNKKIHERARRERRRPARERASLSVAYAHAFYFFLFFCDESQPDARTLRRKGEIEQVNK